MSVVTDDRVKNGAGRRVSIRRDDNDFVIAFQPEDYIIFRNQDPDALRKVCRFLRGEIVADTTSQAFSENLAKSTGPEVSHLNA
jgi:hypothetical protein